MIGWYVHHQGGGHLRRLQAVLPHLRSEVTVLSSLSPPVGWPTPWVRLAPDDAAPSPRDVTAHGTLHWAPLHDPGLARRSAQVLAWVARAVPETVVVDVSVEVALLVRLAGVPVIVTAMPGDRLDRPHTVAYDLAETLVAPWPATVPSAWPPRWLAKTVHTGAFSEYDGRPRPPRPPRPHGHGDRRALLLWGDGGAGLTHEMVGALCAGSSEWAWQLATPSAPLGRDELWRTLCGADVVVTHAGQNAVAEVAAARAPAVVVADDRPFDEQRDTARAVDRLGVAVGLERWPTRWDGLLDRAVRRGGQAWARWSPGGGAARFAAAVEAGASRRAGREGVLLELG